MDKAIILRLNHVRFLRFVPPAADEFPLRVHDWRSLPLRCKGASRAAASSALRTVTRVVTSKSGKALWVRCRDYWDEARAAVEGG